MQRYDNVAIKATKTSEGFIRDAPIVGRTGILKYKNADGSMRYEYRPPNEAFNADSLASLQGKPITVGHKAMVSAANAAKVQPIGTVLTAGRQDGDTIRADIVIYDLPTSARELSCGYSLDLDETPGKTPDGQHYDAVQRNIRYNHVAVVPRGRAGIARLNMDGEQVIDDEKKGTKKMANDTMTKVRTDSGLEYDAAPEVGVYVEKLKNDIAAAKKEHDTLQAKYDAALADIDKVKKEKQELEKTAKDNFDTAVAERVKMLDVANKHNIDGAEKMNNTDIKKAVIKAVRGDAINLDDKSEDYINAAFDMSKDEGQHSEGLANQRKNTMQHKDSNSQPNKQDELDDPMAALRKLQRDEAEAYMKEVR